MHINLGVLIDNLGSRLSLDILSASTWLEQDITELRILKHSNEHLRQDVLYIADCRMIGKLRPSGNAVNLLCFNSTFLNLKQKPQNANLFLVNGNVSEDDLLNAALDTITNLPKEDIPAELLQQFLNCPDLFSFCDRVDALFGNPALVTDGDGKVLAYTRSIISEDSYWQALRDSVFRELRPEPGTAWPQLVTLGDENTNPTFRQHSGRRVIVCPVVSGGLISAYLCIPELGRTMAQSDLKLAESVKILLEQCILSLRSGPSALVSQTEHFLALLLSGQKMPAVRLCILQDALGWHFPLEMLYVVVIRPKSPAEATRRRREILDALPAEYTAYSVFYNYDVVLLINVSRPIENFEEDLAPLLEPLRPMNVKVGISRPFHELATTYECYQQALESLAYGAFFSDGQLLHSYEQNVIYHILKCYADQGGCLQDLCHPGVLHLKELDRINKTTYLDTFRHYILSGRSLRKTAEALFIHRNTVSYHVSKCLEALNIDLDNGDHLFQVTLSLKIVDYLEMTDPVFQPSPG